MAMREFVPVTVRRTLLAAIALLFSARGGTAQEISYQGKLTVSGAPHTGTCDFVFSAHDTLQDPAGVDLVTRTLQVSAGLFTTTVPYPDNGTVDASRYLGIRVRCPGGSGGFTPLAPRQTLQGVVAHSPEVAGAFFSDLQEGIGLKAHASTGIFTRGSSIGLHATADAGGAAVIAEAAPGASALYADGPVRQTRTHGGFVKALVRMSGNALSRCFDGYANDFPAAETCASFAISGSNGVTTVTFPFQVDDRFVVVTPEYAASSPVMASYDFTASNQVRVRTWTCSTAVSYAPCAAVASAYTIAVY
jgi:hypothetical protein